MIQEIYIKRLRYNIKIIKISDVYNFVEKLELISSMSPDNVLLMKCVSINNNEIYIHENKMFISLTQCILNKSTDFNQNQVIKDLINGVLNLHSLGIIHNNLHPNNVLLDNSGRLVISDYCINDIRKDFISSKSALYYSPEMIYCKEITTASDIWSIGCIMYFILTGENLYNSVLNNKNDVNIINKYGRMICDCTNENISERPKLCEIIKELDCINIYIIVCKKTFYNSDLILYLFNDGIINHKDLDYINNNECIFIIIIDILKEIINEYNKVNSLKILFTLIHLKWLDERPTLKYLLNQELKYYRRVDTYSHRTIYIDQTLYNSSNEAFKINLARIL